MNKTKVNTFDFTETGDYALDSLTNLVEEIDALLGHVNTLFKLSSGSGIPTGAQAEDVYVEKDADGVRTLKVVTGVGTSENLGATGNFDSGVDLDDFAKGWANHALIAKDPANPTTRIYCPALAAAPATVCLPNGDMLQNTASVYLSFVGADAGEYQVYAERDGSTTNFTLGKAARGAALTTGQLKLGEVSWTDTGVGESDDFRRVEAAAYWPMQGQPPRGVFHYTRTTAGTAIAHAVATRVPLPVSVIDSDLALNPNAASQTFVCQRAGRYRIQGSVRLSLSAAKTWVRHLLQLRKGATVLARAETVLNKNGATGLDDFEEVTTRIPAVILDLALGDQLDLYSQHTCSGAAGTALAWASGWNSFDTAIWGEYLGETA